MGGHVPGEMGGLWVHPIKLIDGFWVRVTDVATNQERAVVGEPTSSSTIPTAIGSGTAPFSTTSTSSASSSAPTGSLV